MRSEATIELIIYHQSLRLILAYIDKDVFTAKRKTALIVSFIMILIDYIISRFK